MITDIEYDADRGTVGEASETSLGPPVTASPSLFYDTLPFHEYHSRFVDSVFRITIVSGGHRLAWCVAGVQEGSLRLPYSAPFGMIYPGERWRLEHFCAAARGLVATAQHVGCVDVQVTLPPQLFSRETIHAQTAALGHEGFRIRHMEINHYFDLADFTDPDDFLPRLYKSGQKNYRRACCSGLTFEPVPLENLDSVYRVIQRNREAMGYPLRMSCDHIADVIAMPNATVRLFGVRSNADLVAAAIVFDVSVTASQVVYWGDLREHQSKRPMSLLAMRLIECYKKQGKHYLDIGPSSEGGRINFGLADFKRGLGCRNTLRPTLVRSFDTSPTSGG